MVSLSSSAGAGSSASSNRLATALLPLPGGPATTQAFALPVVATPHTIGNQTSGCGQYQVPPCPFAERPPMTAQRKISDQAGLPVNDPPDDGLAIGKSLHDPEQFAAVFRRHAPQIQRYVMRRIGSDAADDVVAETFLLAFRQR